MAIVIPSLILMIIISLLIVRDYAAPLIISEITWFFTLLSLGCYYGWDYGGDTAAYYIILATIILYQAGFIIASNLSRNRIETPNIAPRNAVNVSILKYIIIFESIITLIILINFISHTRYSIDRSLLLTSMKSSDSENYLNEPKILQYARSLILAFTIAISVIWFSFRDTPNRKLKLLFITQLILGVVCSATQLNRTGMFLVIVSLLTAYVYSRRPKLLTVLRAALITTAVFLVFFIIYAYYKYGYRYAMEDVKIGKLIQENVIGYLTIPVRCFIEYIKRSQITGYGKLTFRFFLALFNDMGFRLDVPSLIMPYTYLNDGVGNVYTYIQFYYQDGGWAYVVAATFTMGVLSGFTYKKAITGNLIWIYAVSALMYPTVMQFFADQYISLLSQWLQWTIVGLFVFKSGFIIPKLKIKNTDHSTNGTESETFP